MCRSNCCVAIAPAPQRPDPGAWPRDRVTASWLGHATVLLDLLGARILTDPALEPRIGEGRPQLLPATPGRWRQLDGHTLAFRPQGIMGRRLT